MYAVLLSPNRAVSLVIYFSHHISFQLDIQILYYANFMFESCLEKEFLLQFSQRSCDFFFYHLHNFCITEKLEIAIYFQSAQIFYCNYNYLRQHILLY